MNPEIAKKLHMLRAISPDRGAMERGKREILAIPNGGFSVRVFWREQPAWRRTLAYAFAVALLLIIPALSVNRGPSLSSLKDADKLSAEAASLPISIELREVRYQENRNELIGEAITEIEDTNVRHLKTNIIESELESASPSSNEDEIERLLEQITS